MTDTRSRTGAIVLAGGRSSRFGGDKLAAPIHGRSLLSHAIDAVAAIADVVVVVTAPGSSREVPEFVVVASDRRPFEGPLAGLAVGLAALPASVERVVAVGGDMPALVVPVLESMLRHLDKHDAVVLADAVGPRPLPLVAQRVAVSAAANDLLALGERRLRALLEVLDVDVIPPATWRIDDPAGTTLRDVDTPADLHADRSRRDR